METNNNQEVNDGTVHRYDSDGSRTDNDPDGYSGPMASISFYRRDSRLASMLNNHQSSDVVVAGLLERITMMFIGMVFLLAVFVSVILVPFIAAFSHVKQLITARTVRRKA
jgi:hypothetical protein